MRIATNQHANAMLTQMYKTYGNWNKAQMQVSTGMKYANYSENTAAAARILSLNNAIADIARIDSNIDDANGVLATSEVALSGMNSVLMRINELALQASNGTSADTDVHAMKVEIDELMKQVVEYANKTDNGMYVFGGAYFSERPFVFNEETGQYEYRGSDRDHQFNIKNGYSVSVLKNGEGLTDVLNNLQDISNALGEVAGGNEDSRGQLGSLIDQLRDGITTVTGMLTDVGTTMSGLNTYKTAVSSQRIELEARLSNLEEVDQTQAITDVSLTRFAYEATLSMINQVTSVSILKYM